MATSGSGTLYPNNGSYDCPVTYEWSRDSNGVVTWKAQIFAIGGGSGQYDSSPCWKSFYIRGGNNAQNNLTGDLTEYCSSCSQCATNYNGRILWQHNDVRGGSLTGTIDMGSGGGTLKLGYYGQRNSTYTSEDYLTWSVDPTYVRPSTPSVSIAERYEHGAKFNVSISSYGNPSTGYIEAAILSQNTYGAPYRYATATNVTSSAITVDNSKSGTLDVQSNTQYYYGAYATNNQTTPRNTIGGTFYTMPAKPTVVSLSQYAEDAATFNLDENSQGTAQLVQLQYRYKKSTDANYGSWIDSGTPSNHQSNVVDLTGLEVGASYDLQVRAKAGSGDYSEINTYQNAFTVMPTTVTITDVNFAYADNNGANDCTTTFDTSVSSVLSAPYQLNYKITDTVSGTVFTGSHNVSATDQLVVDLPKGRTYSGEFWIGASGPVTVYAFETPDFMPTMSIYSAEKDVRGYQIKVIIQGSFGLGMNTGNKIRFSEDVFNAVTGNWEGSGGGTTTGVFDSSAYTTLLSFTKTGTTPSTKGYPKYTKIRFNVQITNTAGFVLTKQIIVENPPFIGGKVLPGTGGQRLNIIGSAVKDKNGVLADPRYHRALTVIK